MRPRSQPHRQHCRHDGRLPCLKLRQKTCLLLEHRLLVCSNLEGNLYGDWKVRRLRTRSRGGLCHPCLLPKSRGIIAEPATTNLERQIGGPLLLAIEDWKLGKRDMRLYLQAGTVLIPTGRHCRLARRRRTVKVRRIEAQEHLLIDSERDHQDLETTHASRSRLSDEIPRLGRNGTLLRSRHRAWIAMQLILRYLRLGITGLTALTSPSHSLVWLPISHRA